MDVAREFSRVTVSLDAASDELYQQIRGVAGLTVIQRGVARLRSLAPEIAVTARATLHRLNYRELPRLIDAAKAMAFDSISFLPADMSSSAFGRSRVPQSETLALGADDQIALERLIEETIVSHAAEIDTGFVTESPAGLRRLGLYYSALSRGSGFPPIACNAPYHSIVIEADGDVRPCLFHEPIGNVRRDRLDTIVRQRLAAFRRTLDIGSNEVCARCVSAQRSGWRNHAWH
jgi:MoaA/NifB/PqqE/SkfB family radical SAM enzyme